MHRVLFVAVFVALAVATRPVSTHGQGPDRDTVEGVPANVEASIRARIASGDHPGFVVGLLDADGARVHGYGGRSRTDSAAPGGETRYEIGSITKVFTALLLADAVTRGEVQLEDPAARYLPDSLSLPDAPGISLAHLAEHTSGLPRMPDNLAPADPADLFADYGAAELYAFLEAFEPERESGAAYEYSNLGAGLLGHILARRADTTYEALVRSRVLVPLGLANTGITMDASAQTDYAPGHSERRAVPNWHFDALAGAGALRSTADDLLHVLAVHLNDAPSPLSAAIRRVLVPRVHVGMAEGDSIKAGLGWHFRAGSVGRIVWHNGGTGGYRSFIGFIPETGQGVVVLTNGDRSVDDLGFHLLDPSIPLVEGRPTVEVSPETLARYVGTYRLAPTLNMTVTLDAGQLFGQMTGERAFALYTESDTHFFLKVVDAEVAFELDAGNTVTGLMLYQNGLEIPGKRIEPRP